MPETRQAVRQTRTLPIDSYRLFSAGFIIVFSGLRSIVAWYRRRSDGSESFPLDCAGGLAGDVVDDPVDAAHFIDDAGGGLAQEVHVELVEVRRHAID